MMQKLDDLWTDSSAYKQCYQGEDEIDAILRLLDLATASTLVDVGCGNGAFAVAAARRYPRCRVRAFDALESAVAQCRAAASDLPHGSLTADVAWAHALPLADASADRALCRSVLHHVADADGLYREIARVLAPGGRLVLQAPCNYWERAFADVLAAIMMMCDDTHRRSYYHPEDVVAGLERAGLSVSNGPECWPYSFPFLDDDQAALVRRHGADKRLKLRAIGTSKWCIENYWVRVTASKDI